MKNFLFTLFFSLFFAFCLSSFCSEECRTPLPNVYAGKKKKKILHSSQLFSKGNNPLLGCDQLNNTVDGKTCDLMNGTFQIFAFTTFNCYSKHFIILKSSIN